MHCCSKANGNRNVAYYMTTDLGPVRATSKKKSALLDSLQNLNFYPPASEASREVANVGVRKNLHTHVNGVKVFVCLSVCLSTNSTPIISAEHNF